MPAKPGELKARWGRVARGCEPELVYEWGGAGAASPDARVLSRVLEDTEAFQGKTLIQELEARGYDISTLRFSIKQKKTEA